MAPGAPNPVANRLARPNGAASPAAPGHPLMTTEAILAGRREFRQLPGRPVAGRRPARRHPRDLRTYTPGPDPDLRIMDLMDAQPEFTKAFWDYLDLLVSDTRIKRGHEILAQHRTIFDAVEKAYGVDRHIVAAIWGIEFEFRHLGRRSAGGALDRDAGLCRPPPGLFPRRIPRHAGNPQPRRHQPDRLKGSWAGAFGPTQFMPTSFKRYAVDFDGDGRRDVVDSVPDLIASTANNLKLDGWVPARPGATR